MTPDRHDEQPDEEAEHGILADTGNLETASIGLLDLDAGTAQVRVVLPSADEDDLVEDDVVVDEVPVATVEDVEYDRVATGDIILEDFEPADETAAVDAHDAVEVQAIEDAVDPGSDAVDEIASTDSDAPEPAAEDTAFAPAPFMSFAGPAVIDAEPEEPAAAETPVDAPSADAPVVDPPADEVAARGDSVAVGAPVPLPATRREAHLAASPSRGERAHAAERVHPPHPEPALVSKRLGELADNRESADLLTADRLLDRAQLSGAEPEGLWQQFVYSLSGHRINLGDSRRARARKDLDRRIAAPLPGGARFVPVLSRKGGVGKTTITTLLGMALASARDDRIIAVDANPDRGTLADRIGRPSGRTVRDLARSRGEVNGFNDISTIVARDETRLDVLASDADPRVSEAFSDLDYHDVAALAAHYYSIVLTDTGTGIVHSVMGATLELADAIVVVAGLSVDEARLASETLTWLETNGYADAVKNAVVVLNNARPGVPLVREAELEAHFRSRVRAVIRMPYDPLIGTGSAISFTELQPATRRAAREVAAAVVEGLRALAPAA